MADQVYEGGDPSAMSNASVVRGWLWKRKSDVVERSGERVAHKDSIVSRLSTHTRDHKRLSICSKIPFFSFQHNYRFFTVDFSKNLFYYGSSEHSKKVSIPIYFTSMLSVTSRDEQYGNPSDNLFYNLIELQTTEKDFVLVCESCLARNAWLDVFNHAYACGRSLGSYSHHANHTTIPTQRSVDAYGSKSNIDTSRINQILSKNSGIEADSKGYAGWDSSRPTASSLVDRAFVSSNYPSSSTRHNSVIASNGVNAPPPVIPHRASWLGDEATNPFAKEVEKTVDGLGVPKSNYTDDRDEQFIPLAALLQVETVAVQPDNRTERRHNGEGENVYENIQNAGLTMSTDNFAKIHTPLASSVFPMAGHPGYSSHNSSARGSESRSSQLNQAKLESTSNALLQFEKDLLGSWRNSSPNHDLYAAQDINNLEEEDKKAPEHTNLEVGDKYGSGIPFIEESLIVGESGDPLTPHLESLKPEGRNTVQFANNTDLHIDDNSKVIESILGSHLDNDRDFAKTLSERRQTDADSVRLVVDELHAQGGDAAFLHSNTTNWKTFIDKDEEHSLSRDNASDVQTKKTLDDRDVISNDEHEISQGNEVNTGKTGKKQKKGKKQNMKTKNIIAAIGNDKDKSMINSTDILDLLPS